jgi:transposase-like protein
MDAPSYRGFRFPPEIISHAVWLYHRFPLSFREVEELLLARRIVVSFRDDPAVVRTVWAGVCGAVAPTPAQARGQVVSG